MASRETIVKVVTMLEEMDPRGKEVSDLSIEAYVYVLGGIPDDVLQMAGLRYMETADPAWMPSPARLRELSQAIISSIPSTVRCEEAIAITEKTFPTYKEKIRAYDAHLNECRVCTDHARPRIERPSFEALRDVALRQIGDGK